MNNNRNINTQNQGQKAVLNGQEGSWVPVDPSAVPFSVSQDINNPSVAPDGSYYYAEGGVDNSGFGPIAANNNNAIPSPAQIVQLPPIVQPIALVPYASQNQPMLQYDADYRPEIETSTNEPIYRAKPYAGLSVLLVLLSLAVCVLMYFFKSVVVVSGVSALDSIFGLATMFKLGNINSVYYTEAMQAVFANGFVQAFKADLKTALMVFLIPVFYALSLLFAVILVIFYLVKLGRRASPRGFSVLALFGLLFTGANIAIMILHKDFTQAIGSYILAAVFLVLFILPFFAKRGAQVLDYAASKRTFRY